MQLIMISILFTKPDYLLDFQGGANAFWDLFRARGVNIILAGTQFVEVPQGSFCRQYYYPKDRSPKEVGQDSIVRQFARELQKIYEDALSDCVFTVLELNRTEKQRLYDKDLPQLQGAKWYDEFAGEISNSAPTGSAADQNTPAPGGDTTAKSSDTVARKTDTSGSVIANKPTVATKDTGGLPDSLEAQAVRLRDLKAGLLARIKGQRHAVDEFVESIFASESFTARNEKRKGPLATFLFVGPSGVGKTYLAQQSGELLGRPMLIVDMSEYSDNLANLKFNGAYDNPAIVTGFVRKHPNGILLFDEVEKAHINTIHLFLQILDAGRLMDMNLKQEVSFRDTIIIMTTNAGRMLYEDASVCDLSSTPRSVILDALRRDRSPDAKQPIFPECITTRFANGNVILFNHLEPYALIEIVRDEIALQFHLFQSAYGVDIAYDGFLLAATILYHGGGISDARTLRGLARNVIVRELQEVVMQAFARSGEGVNRLRHIRFELTPEQFDAPVRNLFINEKDLQVMVYAAPEIHARFTALGHKGAEFCFPESMEAAQKRVRGVVDFVLVDPYLGYDPAERMPNDVDDLMSEGMELIRYLQEFYPEVPVYLLDVNSSPKDAFESLLAHGVRGVVPCGAADGAALNEMLESLGVSALINNSTFALSRSSRMLRFNCAQFFEDDGTTAIVRFQRMRLKNTPSAEDSGFIVQRGTNSGIMFRDIIGCKAAKQTLKEYSAILNDPRSAALSGKRMPKGVLLYGPPGTGKTMLAKAMSNETGASFLPTTATSFFGSYVGESERNIRELFAKARRNAPSIIFIDEVDAIGRMRTGSAGSTHNEDALNAFIAEMEGFKSDDKRPIFILAATNYDITGDSGRVLDPAFVRRFDRRILIDLPDAEERFEQLRRSLKRCGVNFGTQHRKILRNMATRSGGMSNADIETMIDMFLRAVADDEPDSAKFMDSLDAFRFGEINKMNAEQLRQTACHESGHALVSWICGNVPAFLTVVSRGSYGGFMEHDRDETKSTMTYRELMDRVCCALAGRAAEIELYGDELGMNTGASADLKYARYEIQACLSTYGMGVSLYAKGRSTEAEQIMKEQFERARSMISERRDLLIGLTDLLTAQKSMDQAQLNAFFAENAQQ